MEICVIIVLAIVSAYLFAENRGLKERGKALTEAFEIETASLREWNKTLKEDRDKWIDKATVRQGLGLLGREREIPKPPDNINPAPKIILRGDLEQRYEEVKKQESRTSPIDISAAKVVPGSIVEKAKKILDK